MTLRRAWLGVADRPADASLKSPGDGRSRVWPAARASISATSGSRRIDAGGRRATYASPPARWMSDMVISAAARPPSPASSSSPPHHRATIRLRRTPMPLPISRRRAFPRLLAAACLQADDVHGAAVPTSSSPSRSRATAASAPRLACRAPDTPSSSTSRCPAHTIFASACRRRRRLPGRDRLQLRPQARPGRTRPCQCRIARVLVREGARPRARQRSPAA